MRAVSSVVITLISVFLVIGLARYALNGFQPDDVGGLLPDSQWFISQFRDFPNLFVELGELKASYESVCTPNYGSGPAGFLAELFATVFGIADDSGCKNGAGFLDFLTIMGIVVSYPVRVVIWLMGVIL